MNDKNCALLIDADNVSPKYIRNILEELNAFGTVSIRRIYGNWRNQSGWNEELLLEYAIQPIQQFDYTKGKNATDIALIIDAMDILYTKKPDIICIVTSDSDFTRLVMRLRESQVYVIGMGEAKTPVSLTKACDKFVHLDLVAADETTSKSKLEDERKNMQANVTPIQEIQNAIVKLVNEVSDTDDAIELAAVGTLLSKQFPDFDVRNYGYTKLSVLIRQEFPKITLIESGNNYNVSVKNDLGFEEVVAEIKQMISDNGGIIENLSTVYETLKAKHKGFKIKNYGFSRISSLLKSIEGIEVHGNCVRLSKKKTKKVT